MAIDQDIQQRVDAYRGNPQALMQRYQQNQQLLDLLALQRLKTEKDEAARKVQMEMQQNPQTIKQQREQQLLEMTKQDLAKQTQGIMQNAQAQQQKNMQRVAKQGAASPQQMQQVASGLGALAQRQAAPRMMAGGGVVAFYEGGITQADVDAYKRRTRGIASRNWRGKSDEEIARMLAERRGVLDATSDRMSESGIQTAEPIKPLDQERTVSVITPVQEAPEPETSEPTEVAASDKTLIMDDTLGPTEEVLTQTMEQAEAGPNTTLSAPQNAPIGMQSPTQYVKENPVTFDRAAITEQLNTASEGARGKALLEEAGLGLGSLGSPTGARDTAEKHAAEVLRREENRKALNERLEGLKALDVSQTDPEKLRQRRMFAGMISAGGRGSTALAALGAGMLNEEIAQEQSQRQRLVSQFNLHKSALDFDLDTGKTVLASGENAYNQAMQNRRSAAQILNSATNRDIQTVMEIAKYALDADKTNLEAMISAANAENTAALRAAMDSADRRNALLGLLDRLQKQRSDIRESILKSTPAFGALQAALLDAQRKGDQDAMTVAQANMDQYLKNVDLATNQLSNSGKEQSINRIEDVIIRLLENEGVDVSSLSRPSAAALSASTEGWGDVTVK